MITILRIALPWPDRVLHPNSRAHWRALATAKKKARADAYLLAIDAGCRRMQLPGSGPLRLWLDFSPPDRRRRDLDGCVSSMKATIDGIADALGIDDSRFSWHSAAMREPAPQGLVVVTVTSAQS